MAEPISVQFRSHRKVDLTGLPDKFSGQIFKRWQQRMKIWPRSDFVSPVKYALDVYCSDSYTAKSLWDELDRKYNTEEQGLEKYSVSKFMRYQMVEDRSVAEQTHEIINLEHALADAETKLPEKFLVMSIVDKFPKSWKILA
ncbi:UNVERIFIED_CONTAM: hypothetical protein Sradi_2688500 [Sesamum radiatum]|uniref:Uncharacterized protein n=1 Tax=Sesamum radiatum TaxID=300843 RepID=A0AAW2S6G7_SESRA